MTVDHDREDESDDHTSDRRQSAGSPGQATSRRTFLTSAAGAALGLTLAPTRIVSGKPSNPRPNVAFVGTGGRGSNHVRKMASMDVNCPCFCDVDQRKQKPARKRWPDARAYQDYRRMFHEMGDQIDAVFVSTPDHHHFPASAMAMQRNIHVYCEKPLTWSPVEARKLKQLAVQRDLVTQMGNQGHASNALRDVIGYIRSGAIGEIKEVHSWTNRPIWPQGMTRPDRSDPVPDYLNWNTWLGPAGKIPFVKNTYHPFKWRGWYPFGTGALGDMACHVMDAMFWSLKPGRPNSVELVEVEKHNAYSYPVKSTVKWTFPKRGNRPAFDAYWYDGKRKFNHKPPRPDEISKETWKKQNTGNLYIGTKGKLRIFGAYGKNHRILPESLAKEVGKPDPEYVPQPSPGHHKEFLLGVQGKGPEFPRSNFSYAGPMNETILLGAVAQRRGNVGTALKIDGEDLQITNDSRANQLLRRTPRDGWNVH